MKGTAFEEFLIYDQIIIAKWQSILTPEYRIYNTWPLLLPFKTEVTTISSANNTLDGTKKTLSYLINTSISCYLANTF